jgi:hypothetical protein
MTIQRGLEWLEQRSEGRPRVQAKKTEALVENSGDDFTAPEKILRTQIMPDRKNRLETERIWSSRNHANDRDQLSRRFSGHWMEEGEANSTLGSRPHDNSYHLDTNSRDRYRA